MTSFVETAHFRASRLPVNEVTRIPHDAFQRSIRTRDESLSFQMSKSDAGLLLTAFIQADGRTLQREASVGMIYGAGGGDEVHHSWQGDELVQLPIAWIHPWQRWSNSPGFLDGTADFRRPVTPRCLECHTTFAQTMPGASNRYVRNSIMTGISCERCHGPAAQHVDFHSSHPDENSPKHIVMPASLNRQQQLDLCNQCHSNATHRKQPSFSYRPGETLTDYFRLDQEPRPEHGHTANHAQFLAKSACFSDGSMTCATCHNPHIIEGQDNSASAKASCLVCHETHNCSKRPDLPAAVQDQCLDCHMPSSRVMNIHVETADDEFMPVLRRREHRIGIYPAAAEKVLLDWLRTQPDKASSQQAGAKAASLIAARLKAATDLEQKHRYLAAMGELYNAAEIGENDDVNANLARLKSTERTQRLKLKEALGLMEQSHTSEAIELFNEVIEHQPSNAVALGKLGAALAITERMPEALERLQQAADADPDDPYGYSMLGWLNYLDGRHEVAVEHFQHARQIAPHNAMILHNMSLPVEQVSGVVAAIRLLEEAARISPSQQKVQQRLSALRSQARAE